MKKLAIALSISALLLTPLASAKPGIDHTTFYQQQLEDGEKITFGVQFEDPESDISHATASLHLDGQEIGFTPLLDRQGDEFYAGSLGPVKGGNTYRVKIKGCNNEGGCVVEHYRREAHCSLGAFGACLG